MNYDEVKRQMVITGAMCEYRNNSAVFAEFFSARAFVLAALRRAGLAAELTEGEVLLNGVA